MTDWSTSGWRIVTDTGTIGFTDVDLTDVHSVEHDHAVGGRAGHLTASVSTDTDRQRPGGVVTLELQRGGQRGRVPGRGPSTEVESFDRHALDGHGGT